VGQRKKGREIREKEMSKGKLKRTISLHT
jgi:hypothetical protein